MNTDQHGKLNPRLLVWGIFLMAVALAAVFLKTGIGVRPPSDRGLTPDTNEESAYSEPEPLKILFGGDIFLDRSIRRQIEANNVDYPWVNIQDFLKSYKYKVANLEGPIWDRPQAAPTGSFSFAFQEGYVRKLKDLGFTVLSLANNHTLNQGQKGLENSRRFLQELGINYFGDPNNEAEFSYTTFVYANEELLPELEYSSSDPSASAEGESRSSLRQSADRTIKMVLVGEHDLVTINQAAILQKITELDFQGYFVVVYPHWGPEYVLTIPKIEQDRAHALIDAGADLIIGAHPHVVQPVEIYKGGVILYSLGNFLFDQGFSYDTMHGLLVEATFEDAGIKFVLYPTEQNKTFQVSLAPNEARTKMLERIVKDSLVSDEMRQSIKSGEFFVSY